MIGLIVRLLIFVAALAVLGAFSQICAYIAERKGHQVKWFAVLGFVAFPLGLIVALAAPNRRFTMPERTPAELLGPFDWDEHYWTPEQRVQFVENGGQAPN